MYNNYYPQFNYNRNQTTYNEKITVLDLNNIIRKLWIEHIIWTKLTIMSMKNNYPDTRIVTERLLRNSTDFGNLFFKFYGHDIALKFSELMKEHLVVAANLVDAAIKQDNNTLEIIEKKWYKNADDIAEFLSMINPYWNKAKIKTMMYNHLALTKSEAVAIITNNYMESITIFDEIENQALLMADAFFEGFIKQFPNRFLKN